MSFSNIPSFFSSSWQFLICDVLNFLPGKLVLSFMKRIKQIMECINIKLIYFLNDPRYAEVLG